jgi:hypothetical protein
VIAGNDGIKAVLLDLDSSQKLVDAQNLPGIISIGDNDLKQGRFVTHANLDEQIQTILIAP